MAEVDHSKHSWMAGGNKMVLSKPGGEYRKTIDKDDLTPDERRRVEEYKEELTYHTDRDPFYD